MEQMEHNLIESRILSQLQLSRQTKDKEYVYIDKYYPNSLSESIIDEQLIKNILSCSNNKKNMPHLLISGPSGSCKKTLVDLFLKETNLKYKKNCGIVDIKLKNSKKIEVKIIKSNYHIQLNPSIHGVHDRTIIQEFINEIIQTSYAGSNFITIVIEEADKLAINAQESLRRTIEKYICNCRFIFIQNSNSCIIPALESRTFKFSLSAPSNENIYKVLRNIIENENININEETLQKLIEISDRNLKVAINNLNIYALNNQIIENNEHEYIDNIFSIFENKSLEYDIPICVKAFRENLNTLLVHCIDPLIICKKIFNECLKKTNTKAINKLSYIVEEFTYCCDNLKNYNKPIYHLEQFVMFLFVFVYHDIDPRNASGF